VGENENTPILGKNEKIFLTGHTGFKGTWLTLLLEAMGHEVIGYSLDATPGSLYVRLDREGLINETIADIRDIDSLRKAIYSAKPSIVIHMAAQPLVLQSYKFPRETFETNAQGTANLLEAAFATSSVKTIGAVTTDKVYKNLGTNHAYVENDPLEGTSDPYSASKVAAEAVICGYRKISQSYGGPNITTLRSGNVIGGGDLSEDRLIPDLVRSHLSETPVLVRNPISTRPWMHVLDSLIGYLQAIENSTRLNQSNVYNFAPTDLSLTVEEVIAIALEIWPEMFTYQFLEKNGNNLEAQKLNLDSSKAFLELEWKARWSQRSAVAASIGWWKRVIELENSVKEACQSEILEALR
jgi:CDP-glucose 4,6-dehydratase